MCNIAFFIDITKYYVEYLYGLVLLRLEIQAILVDRLFPHLPIKDAWLDKFPARAQLLHRLRLVEFLLELLQRALDVVAFFDLNAQHDFLIGRQKYNKSLDFHSTSAHFSNSRLMTSF